MNKKNFLIGMGMGLIVGGCTMCMMRPKKYNMKKAVCKTLHSMGEVADSVTDMMGW